MEKKNNKSNNISEVKEIKNNTDSTEEITNEVVDTAEKVKVEIVKEKKKDSELIKKIKDNKNKLIICVIALILLIGIIIFIINFFNKDEIKKVSKVLPTKYYSIECLTNDCSGIVAYKGNKLGKSKVTVLNKDGKTIAKYKSVYDSKAKIVKEPYAVSNRYFIYKKINKDNNKIEGYSIAGRNGKETYATKQTLKVLNDNLVLMVDTNKGINAYTIVSPRGKELYKNVNDYELYADKKVISAEIDGSKQILDKNGNTILSNYYVVRSINNDNGDTLYLLVEDDKNNSYNYFDVKNLKIVGDSFQSYTVNEDQTLTITKKENNKNVKYILDAKGKQKLIGDGKTQSEIADEIRNTIDSKKYTFYSTSIYDKDQKYILVDRLDKKEFGLYNLQTKKFKKIYSYKNDASNLYSSISKITNENNLSFYQISCSSINCSDNKFYVLDLNEGKVLYNLSDETIKINNYYQYEGGYKVVKYSNASTNEEYKGKYVLYNDKNKEIAKSLNNITVIDKKQLIGYETKSSLILYSAKYNKVLNDDNTLGTKLTLNDKVYYRYQNKNNVVFVNEKGKEVLKVNANSDIIYSEKVLVFINGKKLNIFNASTGKIRKYTLKNNEKMNDASGDLIAPYRGAIFINNTADNHIKVLNSKGNIIKKVNRVELQSVHKTEDGNVIIITRNDTGKTQTYGLYIAK